MGRDTEYMSLRAVLPFSHGLCVLPPAVCFQSSTGSDKAKRAAKSDITTFFSPKSTAERVASGGGSSSTPSKKRKAGTKSPGASTGFVSFCRANRTRVSLPRTRGLVDNFSLVV